MATLGGAWSAVSAQLASDLKAAWPDLAEVHLDWPPTPPESLPYAVAVVEAVESEFASVRTLHSKWRVAVYGVFATPEGGVSRMDEAVARHDALSVRLEGAPVYAANGMLPHVSMFEPRSEFDVREGAWSLRIEFQITTSQQHGS